MKRYKAAMRPGGGLYMLEAKDGHMVLLADHEREVANAESRRLSLEDELTDSRAEAKDRGQDAALYLLIIAEKDPVLGAALSKYRDLRDEVAEDASS